MTATFEPLVVDRPQLPASPSPSSPSGLAALRKAVSTLDVGLRAADDALKAALAAKDAAKKQRSPIDALEDKIMTITAVAAAASGTPEQAQDMLAKARSKALRAAADGADTGTLNAMVQQMEHLAEVAEENRRLKRRGWDDGSAAAIPILATIGRAEP